MLLPLSCTTAWINDNHHLSRDRTPFNCISLTANFKYLVDLGRIHDVSSNIKAKRREETHLRIYMYIGDEVSVFSTVTSILVLLICYLQGLEMKVSGGDSEERGPSNPRLPVGAIWLMTT